MGYLLMRWIGILVPFSISFICLLGFSSLTLCVVTGQLESLGRSPCCYGPELGGGCHCPLWDHSTLRGCWLKGALSGKKGALLTSGWGCPTSSDKPSNIYACPTLHDRCEISVVEEWHPLYLASFRWVGLWGVQWYPSHAFPHSCGTCSPFSFIYLLPLHFSPQWYSHGMLMSGWPCCWCSPWFSSITMVGLCLRPWWFCSRACGGPQHKCHGLLVDTTDGSRHLVFAMV